MNYGTADAIDVTRLRRAGERYRAQTFHYSVLQEARFQPALKLYHGANASFDGYADRNLFATYVHAYFAGQPALARRFVDRCRGVMHSSRRQQ
ncbi:MAG: hypothetical protein E6H75_10235 [Betaproteobacteria bacterium]|nr:MAG: hypothetical protein E6H75_10235 [Betaproteobacteria bacterium]